MSVLLDNLHELTCERLDIRSLLIDKLRAHENQYLMAPYVTIEDYYSIVVATPQYQKRSPRLPGN